jgi:hypothetical protein
MSGVVDTLISGIVKSAMSEILKKTGVKRSTTAKRTKRRTKTAATPSSSRSKTRKAGPVSGSSGRGSRASAATGRPAKKQVSRRKTNAARSRAKRRT